MRFKVEVLPKGIAQPRFEQRESGVAHTSYGREVAFYNCVKNGDLNGVKEQMQGFMSDALVVGRMSSDDLRQAQYFAVSCITLATRYAVEGGLTESEAYNLSDKYIQRIDNMASPEEILDFLAKKAVELTVLVGAHRQRLEYPKHVRQAMKYISAHLHEKIRCEDVANECGVCVSYISASFNKYVGDSLSHYILREKLEEAKELLSSGMSMEEISYCLGFCSQSHFCVAFKKEYGLTAKEYKNQIAKI